MSDSPEVSPGTSPPPPSLAPSFQRLHPSSLFFLIGAQVRSLVLPAVIFVFAGEGSALRFLILLFVLPTAIQPLFHYLSFRYQLSNAEMVVREGVLFRNERRIPFSRIHNVDLVQNPLHRLFGVGVVRLETASGGKPEAVMRVLSLPAIDGLRATIGSGSESVDGAALIADSKSEAGGAKADERRLLRLPPSELVRLGLTSNQGLVVVAGALALFFQQDLINWEDIDWEGIDWQNIAWLEWASGPLGAIETMAGSASWIVSALLVLVASLVAVAALYLFSIALAFLRFYGFTLVRRGDFLRAQMGLITRIAQTTPRRRIQHLRTQQGPVHRLLGRSSIRMDTAGGNAGGPPSGGSMPTPDPGGASRQWLAPLIVTDGVQSLMKEAMPDVEIDGDDWLPIAQRAWKRRFRVGAAFFTLLAIGIAFFSLWALWIAVLALPLQFFWARRYVASRHYRITDRALLWRSGWWRRSLSVVPFRKIQAVSLSQSPFDRRHWMANLRIDTAGASRAGYAIDIRYLDETAARELARTLHTEAAGRAFDW